MKENNWRRTNGSGRASRVVLRPNCSWIEQRQSACEIAHETKSNPDREPFSGNSHGHGNFGFLQLPSATRQSQKGESENSLNQRDSRLCVPTSQQVCLYRVQSLAKEHLLP